MDRDQAGKVLGVLIAALGHRLRQPLSDESIAVYVEALTRLSLDRGKEVVRRWIEERDEWPTIHQLLAGRAPEVPSIDVLGLPALPEWGGPQVWRVVCPDCGVPYIPGGPCDCGYNAKDAVKASPALPGDPEAKAVDRLAFRQRLAALQAEIEGRRGHSG